MRGYLGAAAALLAGCGGSYADVEGSIGETPFDEVVSVYHGGPFILLFDRKVDCLETSFVEPTYQEGEPLKDFDFVALQFWTDSDAYAVGTTSLADDAPITGHGLINLSSELQVDRGREGTLSILEIDAKDAWIEGTFEVVFGEGSVSGDFRTEYCRNMEP